MTLIGSNDNNQSNQLVDNFFRLEAGRMVSTLTRIFGLDNIDLAEDVVQDAMLKALQQWSFGNVPANPSGWIMQVAKNRALDILRKQSTFQKKVPEIEQASRSSEENYSADLFNAEDVKDDQLRMIFACCHPILPVESQIGLTLKTLCGFGIAEISRSFLSKPDAIAKRLTRARQTLRDARVPFEIPLGAELAARLDSVLHVLYLMFNEGYNASNGLELIRWELSADALRLSELLLGHPSCNTPKTNALHALMLLQASRFPARIGNDGNILLLQDQDRSRWNKTMIEWGLFYLNQSAEGTELSDFHLQAGIAASHCLAESYDATDWQRILSLYDMLIRNNDSPVIALNRAVALSKVHGAEAGLKAVGGIQGTHFLDSYYLLHAVIAEFQIELGHFSDAATHLQKALSLTTVESEQSFLRTKLRRCEEEQSESARLDEMRRHDCRCE